MLASLRLKMSNLSKTAKTVILKSTMIFLLLVGLMALFLSSYEQTPVQSDGVRSQQYSTYMKEYSKKYSDYQQAYRQFLFYQTYDQIIFNNKQLDSNYYEGLNQFSDLTQEEFQELYLIVTSIAKVKGFLQIAQFQDNYYFDWVPFMPPIKNMRDYQGSHIFAVTSVLEFQANKKAVLSARAKNITYEPSANWITLSEQEVIDCCPSCREKKTPKTVYTYLIKYGISLDVNYPYISSIYNSAPGECKTANQQRPYQLKYYQDITSCRDLTRRLQLSPVVVWVDAREWRQYDGGIFQNCGIHRNHYAVVVGRGIGYWKIRNSWGIRWGEHGHIRIKSGNTCGVCGKGSYAEIQ